MKAKAAPGHLQENSVRGRNSNVVGKQVSDREESCILYKEFGFYYEFHSALGVGYLEIVLSRNVTISITLYSISNIII